jgi:hypothetical protein
MIGSIACSRFSNLRSSSGSRLSLPRCSISISSKEYGWGAPQVDVANRSSGQAVTEKVIGHSTAFKNTQKTACIEHLIESSDHPNSPQITSTHAGCSVFAGATILILSNKYIDSAIIEISTTSYQLNKINPYSLSLIDPNQGLKLQKVAFFYQ